MRAVKTNCKDRIDKKCKADLCLVRLKRERGSVV